MGRWGLGRWGLGRWGSRRSATILPAGRCSQQAGVIIGCGANGVKGIGLRIPTPAGVFGSELGAPAPGSMPPGENGATSRAGSRRASPRGARRSHSANHRTPHGGRACRNVSVANYRTCAGPIICCRCQWGFRDPVGLSRPPPPATGSRAHGGGPNRHGRSGRPRQPLAETTAAETQRAGRAPRTRRPALDAPAQRRCAP